MCLYSARRGFCYPRPWHWAFCSRFPSVLFLAPGCFCCNRNTLLWCSQDRLTECPSCLQNSASENNGFFTSRHLFYFTNSVFLDAQKLCDWFLRIMLTALRPQEKKWRHLYRSCAHKNGEVYYEANPFHAYVIGVEGQTEHGGFCSGPQLLLSDNSVKVNFPWNQ